MKKLSFAAAVLMLLHPVAHAKAYKCQQASGRISFQDHPCTASETGARINLAPAQGYSASEARPPAPVHQSASTPPSSGNSRYPYAREGDVERLQAQNKELQAMMAKMKADNPNWQHSQTLSRLNANAEALNAEIQKDSKTAH